MASDQVQIDSRNAEFWDELCQTAFAKQLGITDASPENLRRFDAAYLDLYPYIAGHLPEPNGGRQVLEVGLGYGTVSQLLASRRLDYRGLDIAEGPVKMVRSRLQALGVEDAAKRVTVGSALEIPHPDSSFDHVVTIGCLHHTGDLGRGVSEVHRVLRPGGRALVMLYNRHSFRRMQMALRGVPRRLRGGEADDEEMRARYDTNTAGEAAPATDYTSVREARRLFGAFSTVSVRKENFDHMTFRARPVSRDFLLGWPARIAGLDLYITAIK